MMPDIDTMPAGRELDALVAERVMGWRRWQLIREPETVLLYDPARSRLLCGIAQWREVGQDIPLSGYDNIPVYSTSIATAWQIIEHSLRQRGWGFHSLAEGWSAYFFITGRSSLIESDADTAPLAICRAALKAVLSK